MGAARAPGLQQWPVRRFPARTRGSPAGLRRRPWRSALGRWRSDTDSCKSLVTGGPLVHRCQERECPVLRPYIRAAAPTVSITVSPRTDLYRIDNYDTAPPLARSRLRRLPLSASRQPERIFRYQTIQFAISPVHPMQLNQACKSPHQRPATNQLKIIKTGSLHVSRAKLPPGGVLWHELQGVVVFLS